VDGSVFNNGEKKMWALFGRPCPRGSKLVPVQPSQLHGDGVVMEGKVRRIAPSASAHDAVILARWFLRHSALPNAEGQAAQPAPP